MVTSWAVARCSAISRQWRSEPPAMSGPKRWMTHASFIGFVLGLAAEPHEVAPEACVLDRKLLKTEDQNQVQPLLTLEVVQGILVEPSRERQHDPPLHEHDNGPGGR